MIPLRVDLAADDAAIGSDEAQPVRLVGRVHIVEVVGIFAARIGAGPHVPAVPRDDAIDCALAVAEHLTYGPSATASLIERGDDLGAGVGVRPAVELVPVAPQDLGDGDAGNTGLADDLLPRTTLAIEPHDKRFGLG